MRFNKLLALTTVGIMTLSFAGCSANTTVDENNNANTAENAESVSTFKIGGIGPLTGSAASYGLSVKQGAQVAIDEINAQGGVNSMQFELAFEDDECDAEKAISAYNKLMDQDVNAILGAVTSGCCIAVADESAIDGILQVTPSGSAADCTKHENGFRICFTDPMQGELMAQYIIDQGIKNTAVIYDVADEYSTGITNAFVAKYAELGGTISCNESFTTGDVDFKTQLTKVKSSGAECLFLPIYYTEVGYISEQAPTIGLDIPYFGCDGWDGVINQLNGNTANIDGAVFLTPFVATSTDEKTVAFVEAYETAYGATPDQFAADGYDAVYTFKAAIEAANGDVSNEALIQAMTNITVDGVTGSMTFDENGEPNKSANFAIIENGEYVAK